MARRSQSGAAALLLALAAASSAAFLLLNAADTGFVSGVSAVRGVARAPAVARQSEKTDKIVDQLKELTLLEASELVKQIEETFGVDASASGGGGMMMMAAAPAEAEEAAAEQSEFDVIIKEVPKDKKIAVLKVVRNLLGVGLKEAKEKVDNPGLLLEKKPKSMAEEAKTELEAAGAVVELK